MYKTQRIRMRLIDENDGKILDRQSILVTKHYNYLLEFALNKISKDGKRCYISQSELITDAKLVANSYKEFNNLNISFIIGNAYTLNEAIKRFNSGLSNMPKFQSSRLKWMSLFFTNKTDSSIKLSGSSLTINITGENKVIHAKLNEGLFPCNKIVNYRIIKELGRYYILITIEQDIIPAPKTRQSISIDLNHKNFFMAIGSDGIIYEMEPLPQAKYFDYKIAELTSLRDKKKKEKEIKDGAISFKESKSYARLNKAIEKLLHKRNAQIKTAIYMICNFLTDRYDAISIGDYTPDSSKALTKTMARAMVKESYISLFREKLEYVCKKKGKKFNLVDESKTTMVCHCCGYSEAKAPDIRTYSCPKCKSRYLRDVNSAINIGLKSKLFIIGQFKSINLTKPTYIVSYNISTQKLDFKKI